MTGQESAVPTPQGEARIPKRHGGDKRGSAAQRRVRKFWMLAVFGDGRKCHCVHCGCVLRYKTITADRIQPGGPYARWNLQPSCLPCNQRRHWES